MALVIGAGIVYVAGVFVDSPPLAARGALVALSALAGYVVAAGRGVAGWVRWPLAITVLGVGLAIGWEYGWTGSSEYGWFPAPRPRSLLVRLTEYLGPRAILSISLLATGAAAIVAARRLPDRGRPPGRRRWLVIGTAIAGLAMLALLARNVWIVAGAPVFDPDDNRTAQVVLAIVVPLRAGLIALGVAFTAARRASGWLGVLGGVLLAACALDLASVALMWVPLPFRYAGQVASVQGIAIFGTPSRFGLPLGAALMAALLVAAVVCVVVDVLRAARNRERTAEPAEG